MNSVEVVRLGRRTCQMFRRLRDRKMGIYKTMFLEKYGFPRITKISQIIPDFEESFDMVFGPGSSALDLALLRHIAKQYEKPSCLEIGTEFGRATMVLADVSERVVTVDIRRDEAVGKYCKSKNVDIIRTDSRKMGWKKLGKFDLIFIDGDHHYDVILSDTKNSLSVLKDDGTIVWHDVTSDYRYCWDVLGAIFDALPKNRRKDFYVVNGTRCGILTKKEIHRGTKGPDFMEVSIKMKRVDINVEK